jgi:hypothetical protein
MHPKRAGFWFPCHSQDLILDIMTSVQMDRKLELLYANGEMDPTIRELESSFTIKVRLSQAFILGITRA